MNEKSQPACGGEADGRQSSRYEFRSRTDSRKGAAMSNDSEAPLEQTGVLGHLFGVWYPKHYVVGIVEDRSSADRAADALRTAWRDAGAPEDAVRLFHAADAPEAIRRTGG